MPIFLIVLAVVALLVPIAAWAQSKGPLDYSLKQYGFILGVALLGGIVSWSHKVRKGDAQAWNLMQLIGELTTSAFAGLLAFWLCELSGAPALLGAALVGIAGHMGSRAINTFESFALRRWGAAPDSNQPPRQGE
ncbi:MAG: hypothetical protein EOP37_03180 [Rubrivivax sp.]|nr:MAG: hypothetical protein EOP37_03180 [Rubrivivax sp.]